jgi:hypothetical protein
MKGFAHLHLIMSKSASSSSSSEQRAERIRALKKFESNKYCLNCSDRGPQSVNLLFNSFICLSCHSVHSQFNHRCKSISVATFTEEEVKALEGAGGNEAAKAIWLAEFNPTVDSNYLIPSSLDSSITKQQREAKIRQFIQAVYIDKKFIKGSKHKAKASEEKKKKKKAAKMESSSSSAAESSSSDQQEKPKKSKKSKDKAVKNKPSSVTAAAVLPPILSPPPSVISPANISSAFSSLNLNEAIQSNEKIDKKKKSNKHSNAKLTSNHSNNSGENSNQSNLSADILNFGSLSPDPRSGSHNNHNAAQDWANFETASSEVVASSVSAAVQSSSNSAVFDWAAFDEAKPAKSASNQQNNDLFAQIPPIPSIIEPIPSTSTKPATAMKEELVDPFADLSNNDNSPTKQDPAPRTSSFAQDSANLPLNKPVTINQSSAPPALSNHLNDQVMLNNIQPQQLNPAPPASSSSPTSLASNLTEEQKAAYLQQYQVYMQQYYYQMMIMQQQQQQQVAARSNNPAAAALHPQAAMTFPPSMMFSPQQAGPINYSINPAVAVSHSAALPPSNATAAPPAPAAKPASNAFADLAFF